MFRMDMRKYSNNTWEQVDQRPGALQDEIVSANKTSDAANYVRQSDGQVGTRIRVRDDSPAFLASWICTLDVVKHRVTQ